MALYTTSDSGVWARPRSDSERPQDRPLNARRQLSAGLSWCLAFVCFVGIGAIMLGTLFELTGELVELGRHGDQRAH